MSKYNTLWEYIGTRSEQNFLLTFDQIKQIAGIEIDHAFLTFKKELPAYGYQVGKISLKQQTVQFLKIEE